MNEFARRAIRVLGLLAIFSAGCSTFNQSILLEGAVAEVKGERVHIAAIKSGRAEVGMPVAIYQRVQQKAVEPTSPPWHLLKPVATGRIDAVTPEGAWVTIASGSVESHGEIQLRRED